ncbi:MAG: hypothetical protein LBU85_12980 [Treponema sp.]|jgi:hypothetical protein|nr:hypothetical protein [Treponema sp.]
MSISKNSELPELGPAEWEAVAEHAGKLMASGMSREDADLAALKAVLEKQDPEQKVRKGPRFVKIGGAPIPPVRWAVKNFLEVGALGMAFGDSGRSSLF